MIYKIISGILKNIDASGHGLNPERTQRCNTRTFENIAGTWSSNMNMNIQYLEILQEPKLHV